MRIRKHSLRTNDAVELRTDTLIILPSFERESEFFRVCVYMLPLGIWATAAEFQAPSDAHLSTKQMWQVVESRVRV